MQTGALAMRRRVAPLPPADSPPVSNTRLAMIVLITGESMLFAGLIGMYLVFRLAARTWPPPDQPRLPLGLTTLNSAVLLGSAIPLARALGAIRRGETDRVARRVELTALLGLLFLAVQGAEWARLVRHGLTLGSGTYGGSFYVLIGCHALHVLAAVTWLAAVAVLARRGRFTPARHAALEMCSLYWYFVCGLWVVLFPLVYLY
ncbi:MAG: heme-copper oxidase subunit III [Deltaproteobacteria bacterium]|nr:MAG: heme-copper oxidase subunit III [Deltaproteobacteria bacterium]